MSCTMSRQVNTRTVTINTRDKHTHVIRTYRKQGKIHWAKLSQFSRFSRFLRALQKFYRDFLAIDK